MVTLCDYCSRPVNLSVLHVVIYFSTTISLHGDCFLKSKYYRKDDITGKAVIEAYKRKN